MTKLCARGKAAAKRKFKVYPSAYANSYASKICAGKIKDPSGVKRKDFKGPKPSGKVDGGMLKNPKKADLNKDGKLSGYEKKRGMAIEKNMKPKEMNEGGMMVRGQGAAIRGTNFKGVF